MNLATFSSKLVMIVLSMESNLWLPMCRPTIPCWLQDELFPTALHLMGEVASTEGTFKFFSSSGLCSRLSFIECCSSVSLYARALSWSLMVLSISPWSTKEFAVLFFMEHWPSELRLPLSDAYATVTSIDQGTSEMEIALLPFSSSPFNQQMIISKKEKKLRYPKDQQNYVQNKKFTM